MRQFVFDIEADGLYPDKIHCLSVTEIGKPYKPHSTTSYDDMRKFFCQEDIILIGHNICRYDIPHIERLLGIKVKCKRYDTLGLSWYLYPKRVRHGLESWGETLGIAKPVINDWVNGTEEEYIHRCETDVLINFTLWNEMMVLLKRLYGDEEKIARALTHIGHIKMDIAALKEECRWKLDVDRCTSGIAQLQIEREERLRQLKEIMPRVPKYVVKKKPKKCFKQSGALSSLGETWFKLLEEQGLPEDTEEVTLVTHYEEPNPNSHPQIKDFLFSLGWKPDEFKYVKDKETGQTRAIAQVSKQTPGESGLSASVQLLIEKHPNLEALDGLFVVNHRLSLLQGLLESVDEEGYVKAQVSGFTNTLRYTHEGIVNLPRVDKAYGDLCRGVLIAVAGHTLCGSDMSGLEDKIKQHFIYPFDPEYVQKMMRPDYDAHLTLALYAGAISQEEYDGYVLDDPLIKKRIKPVRSIYKNGNYALN